MEFERPDRSQARFANLPDHMANLNWRPALLANMPTLYVLQSLKDNRTYVGSTTNLEVRLLLHNSGRVKSTKHRIPLKVLFTEEFKTIQKAKKRELYYKSGAGRRRLKQFFEKP